MTQIVDKLNEISEAMGGQAAETNQIVDALEEIKKVAPSGESPLPAVTQDDDGYVLTVVDGEWNKAQASGGGTLYRYDVSNLEAVTINAGSRNRINLTLDGYADSEVYVWLANIEYTGAGSETWLLPIMEFSASATSEGISASVTVYNATQNAITIAKGKCMGFIYSPVELHVS